MNPLIFSINAVFPLILVAAFGFYARRNNTLTDDFLKVYEAVKKEVYEDFRSE